MNSNLSLNVVNSILNSSFRRHMTKEYTTLLKSYLDFFGAGKDDDTFYGIVLQNSEYHLQRYKRVGKKAKKSKIEFNKCVEFILKHYIYYLKETGKKEAVEIQISFENKSGVKYDREEIHKLLGYNTLDKKRKRTVTKDKVVKKAKLNEMRHDDVCDEPNVVKEETPKVVFFINFLLMALAMVLHFSKIGFLIFN